MTRRKGDRSAHFMGKSGMAPLGQPEKKKPKTLEEAYEGLSEEDAHLDNHQIRLTRDADGRLVAIDIWYEHTDGYIRVEDRRLFEEIRRLAGE